MNFAYVFKKLRKEYGLNQKDAAKKIGVSQATICMWESGKRFPDREAIEAVADFFNVDMDYLLGRTEIRQKVHFDPDGTEMIYASPAVKRIMAYYNRLNERNKERLFDYLELLSVKNDKDLKDLPSNPAETK